MWVRTQGGFLVNLGRVATIEIHRLDNPAQVRAFLPDKDASPAGHWCNLAIFKNPKQAEAALDRLHQWIAQGGPDYVSFGHVFDFRNLEVGE